MTELTMFWDARVLDHDTGSALHEAAPSPWIEDPGPHTEGRTRLSAMRDVIQNGPIGARVEWADGRLAEIAELERVHAAEYVAEIRRISEQGGAWVTGTTKIGSGSFDPLRAAAGTVLEAADAVLSGRTRMAYALVRPPGHHAQRAQADGYCFFNHAALAADLGRRSGAARVMTVDWDVHHGNGTQEIFYDRDDVLAVSVHMNHGAWGPSHPQTGHVDEVGAGDGHGFNINIPLPLGAGDIAYRRSFDEVIAPIAREFQPDLIVAASGQDAGAFDPNGRHNLTMAGFYAVGRGLATLAGGLCGGRIVLVQEGGYNTSYAPYCLLATLEGLLDVEQTPDPLAYVPDQVWGVEEALADARRAHTTRWGLRA